MKCRPHRKDSGAVTDPAAILGARLADLAPLTAWRAVTQWRILVTSTNPSTARSLRSKHEMIGNIPRYAQPVKFGSEGFIRDAQSETHMLGQNRGI